MKKISLSEIQEIIFNLLSKEDTSNTPNFIIPGGTLKNPEQALNVYKNGYYARFTESLGDIFEAIWWVLGDEDFFNIAEQYIQQTQSTSYNLSDYGDHFPTFLEEHKILKDFPFLKNLAEFELLFQKLFHLKPDSLTPPQNLMELGNESKITFIPSINLFKSKFEIYNIWKARGGENAQFKTEWETPEFLLTYKSQEGVVIYPISEFDHALIELFLLGKTFENVIDSVQEDLISQEAIQNFFTQYSKFFSTIY